jgi:hypothetical protein
MTRLGVSYLLAGQTENGIATLQAVIAAGDTPFLNEAWFYLAKAHLSRRDVSIATWRPRHKPCQTNSPA